jgi:hypothetical protein
MNYRVIWRHALLTQMAAIYVRARESAAGAAAVTAAVAEIDALLASGPSHRGESRGGPERILAILPLVVEFEVYDDDGVALVTAVRFCPRR